MEKQMFKTGKGLTILRVFFLVLILAAAAAGSLWLIKLALTGENIITADTFGQYVYVDVKYASYPFGEDDKGNQYLFISTEDTNRELLHDYMFRISKEGYENSGLKELIEANYSGKSNTLPLLRLHGFLKAPTTEFKDLAAESYGAYVGNDSIEDPFQYLGNAYLEYSTGSKFWEHLDIQSWFFLLVLVIIMVSAIVEMVNVLKRQAKKDRKIALCRLHYANDPEYARGLEEINLPETLVFKPCKCYVTPNYIVSYQDGLEVFRIDQIQELYGYDKSSSNLALGLLFGVFASHQTKHHLVAITTDNEAHMFAALVSAGKVHNQIVSYLLQKNGNILLGRNGIPGYTLERELEALNLARVAGFYGSSDVWKGRTSDSFLL